ncbi:hypothetical protein ABTX77_42340 [Streptomyces sp. NPDC097704]|uniref:hypothetical protein n=1 Tax=Streptomyces sp. NPDC097704 TaxID=3157101 RepID=UPI00333185C9
MSERQQQGAFFDLRLDPQHDVLVVKPGALLLGAAQAPVLAAGALGGDAAAQDLVGDALSARPLSLSLT